MLSSHVAYLHWYPVRWTLYRIRSTSGHKAVFSWVGGPRSPFGFHALGGASGLYLSPRTALWTQLPSGRFATSSIPVTIIASVLGCRTGLRLVRLSSTVSSALSNVYININNYPWSGDWTSQSAFLVYAYSMSHRRPCSSVGNRSFPWHNGFAIRRTFMTE